MKITSATFLKSASLPEHFPGDGRPEVAFVGRSNVGKSSLLNTLLRRKGLAKTSSAPGKTRLVNFFDVNGRFYYVDLPGYGFAKAPKSMRDEWVGLMRAYLGGREPLRLAALLLDIRHKPSAQDAEMVEMLESYERPTVLVATKADKLSRNQQGAGVAAIRRELGLDRDALIIPFSSETGQGRRELLAVIGEVLGAPPMQGDED